MFRFLAVTVLTIVGNALGLLLASWVLDDFSLSASGFLVSVLCFTIAQIILGPFVLKMALSYMPALSGGIALVTTLVSLMLTSLITDGLVILGLMTWVLAPLIIWLTSLLAGVILPLFLFKKTLQNAKERRKGRA